MAVRSTQKKFTVSAAAIISNREGKILLLEHRLRPHSNWGLPSGFAKSGEQPEAVIRREISEETRLELSDLKLLLVRTIDRHVEILFTANTDGIVNINTREIKDFGWFEPETLPAEMSAAQKKIIKIAAASD